MTDFELYRHARHTASNYQREAARQRLAKDAVRNRPTYGLECVYYLSNALLWFATALPAALLVLLLQDRGVTLLQVGFYYGVYALTVAVLEVPSGMLADSWGRKRTVLLAYTLLSAAGTCNGVFGSAAARLGVSIRRRAGARIGSVESLVR